MTGLSRQKKEVVVQLQPTCNPALEGGEWLTPRSDRFVPGKTQYPLYRMVDGSRDGSEWHGKSRVPTEFDLLTVQRTGIPYSGCAMLVTNT